MALVYAFIIIENRAIGGAQRTMTARQNFQAAVNVK
jgi:hypothetical protein